MPNIRKSRLYVSVLRKARTTSYNIYKLLLKIVLFLHRHICLFLSFWILGFGMGGSVISYLFFKENIFRLLEKCTVNSMSLLSTSVAALMTLTRAEEKHDSNFGHKLLEDFSEVRKNSGNTLRISAAEECCFPILLGLVVNLQGPGIGWIASSIFANPSDQGHRAQIRIGKKYEEFHQTGPEETSGVWYA